MSRNGSGTYSLPTGNPVVSGTPITASWANNTLSDIANELTNSIDKAGRTTPTANLPMGGFKLTGLAAGSAAGESVRFEQVLNQSNAQIAVGATVDLAGATATDIEVTGTGGTVTSFGTGAAVGVRKFLRFSGASNVLTNSATLICQGGGNLTMAANDTCIVTSQGANVWRVSHVARAAAVATRLSDVGAAAATNSIDNGSYKQTWQWTNLGASDIGFELICGSGSNNGTGFVVRGPSSGASGFPNVVLQIMGMYGGNAAMFYPAYFVLGGLQNQGGAGSDCTITATGTSVNNANGGHLYLYGGPGGTSSGVGGDVRLFGSPTGNTKGSVKLADGTSAHQVNVTPTAVAMLGTALTMDFGSISFGHTTGVAPTISTGGGTGATIRGSSALWEVTIGTGSPTSVTVAHSSYTTSFVGIPSCTQAGVRLNYTPGSGTMQISSDVALSSGTKITCFVATMS